MDNRAYLIVSTVFEVKILNKIGYIRHGPWSSMKFLVSLSSQCSRNSLPIIFENTKINNLNALIQPNTIFFVSPSTTFHFGTRITQNGHSIRYSWDISKTKFNREFCDKEFSPLTGVFSWNVTYNFLTSFLKSLTNFEGSLKDYNFISIELVLTKIWTYVQNNLN